VSCIPLEYVGIAKYPLGEHKPSPGRPDAFPFEEEDLTGIQFRVKIF